MIRTLSPQLITQIAAGQVIERPASVLKELIENAIDAGAQMITVRIEEGGKKALSVVDDGSGISANEMCLAFERHTTSKIASEEDLQKIGTYGFRGEALCSMAAVAHVQITSKAINASLGFRVCKKNGELLSSTPIAHEQGTRVSVTELFEAVPARKNFLQSSAAELALCLEVCIQNALAHPELSFRIFIDNELEYDLQPTSLLERLQHLSLISHSQEVLHLETTEDGIHISGYIGVPQTAYENNSKQYFFINCRPVSFPQIARVLKHAYGTLLEVRRQPFVVLKITVAPAEVDVNVHPQKERVRLAHQQYILNIIENTVKNILTTSVLQYKHEEQLFFKDSRQMDIALASELNSFALPWHPAQFIANTEIIQINRVYLLAESDRGLIMVDQHAAHERILYEEYVHKFSQLQSKVVLSKEICIALTPKEYALRVELQERFEKLGIKTEWEKKTLRVCSLPFPIDEQNQKEFITELLGSMQEDSYEKLPTVVHRTCAFLACRHAIKAGDVLTLTERKSLLKKLFQTTGQYTCPHGRPVYITVSENELEQWFHRRV